MLLIAHHNRHKQLISAVDQAALAVDRAVAQVWTRLLAVLQFTHGYSADVARVVAVLHQLPGAVVGTLAKRMLAVHQQARSAALASVKRLREAIEVMPDPLGDADTIFQYLMLGSPSQEDAFAWLLPLVRPANWVGIGDVDKRLPWDLANQIAGGMGRGLTQRELADTVRPYLDGSRVRAMRAARTFGLFVAHSGQMAAWQELGEIVVAYQIWATKSPCPPSRQYHQDRNGTIYYANPKSGQKGYHQLPHPPMEAADPAERPPGAPKVSWNCRCVIVPVLSI